MFESQKTFTVGELKELLKKFPDDKPLIIDDGDGNTSTVEIYNWAEEPDDDCDWPLAIRGV